MLLFTYKKTNRRVNSDRNALEYTPLHPALLSKYSQINLINLSLGSRGTVGSSSDSFIELLKSADVDSKMQKAIVSSFINITISYIYYIFYCCSKQWIAPKSYGT